jgi:nucleoside-diphosphate-sugar epimerase
MKVLIIGGTGLISQAVTRLAVARGHSVTLLNRGKREAEFAGQVEELHADKHDPDAFRDALGRREFDVAADFIPFTPADIGEDVAVLAGRVGHFLAISSASAYEKPPSHYLVTEETPLANPFWEYSRNKIAMEQAVWQAVENGFPGTVVRPSLTYSESFVPGVFSSGYGLFHRILQGKPIVSHGDGQSLWQMTFNDDFARGFVGLFGKREAVGQAYHITTDEVLTWDRIYQTMAEAVGREVRLVHVPTDFIETVDPHAGASLRGDKMYSTVLDNTKIKRAVPSFRAEVSLREGMERCLAWFQAHPERKVPDPALDAAIDRILNAHAGRRVDR